MSLAELRKNIETGKVSFGLKVILKLHKQGKMPKKVFVPCDTREETEKKLKKINVEVLKLKEDKEKVSKELKLGFLCEVYSIGVMKVEKEEKVSKTKRKNEEAEGEKVTKKKTTKKVTKKSEKKTNK